MRRRIASCAALTILIILATSCAADTPPMPSESTSAATSAFFEGETEPNDARAEADTRKAIDVLVGVNGTGDTDASYATARQGDRVFAYVVGSAGMDPHLTLFADSDFMNPLEIDDDDGPLLLPVVAGAPVPALLNDAVYTFVTSTGSADNYWLYSYVADPAFIGSEVEPDNDAAGSAPAIDRAYMSGTLTVGDVDYFAFEAELFDTLVVIMDDDPNGDGNAETILTLENNVGVTIATGDDQAAADGNATQVGTAFYAGTHYVRVGNASATLGGEYEFVLLLTGGPALPPPPMNEVEPNFTAGQANGLKTQHSLEATLAVVDAGDRFRMIGNTGDRIYAYAEARQSSPDSDVRIDVLDDNDVTLELDNDDGPGLSAVVAGSYTTSRDVSYVVVTNGSAAPDDISDYHLWAAVVNPNDLDPEPAADNTDSAANPAQVTATIMRGIAQIDDVDYWAIDLNAGDNVVVIVDEDPDDAAGEALDLSIDLRDPADAHIVDGDNTPGLAPEANAVGPMEAHQSGTYFLRVQNNGDTSTVKDDYEFVVIVTYGPVKCGDGDLDGLELCDDGDRAADDGCDDLCAVETGWTCGGEPSSCTEICGDSLLVGSEQCDPPNPGNGCDASCMAEAGWDCSGGTCVPICGDGLIRGAESCDDGQMPPAGGDGCDASCAVETGWTCDGMEPTTCAPTCGDSMLVGGEECDPPSPGNGCDATCMEEIGWDCSSGTCLTICGDGLIRGAETCDDGQTPPIAGDGCDVACAVETGWTCDGMEPTSCAPTCGDSMVIGTEQCDPPAPGNGCDANCMTETGWDCSSGTCVPICGDGLILGPETCDDQQTPPVNGDGCDDTCQSEAGWSCAGEPSVCSTNCGDGLISGAEECDDGGVAAGDGCDASCAEEPGWTCAGEPSICNTVCGDGVIVPGEEACDDGNAAAGDGCSDTCAVEDGWTCAGEPSTCSEDMGTGGMGGAGGESAGAGGAGGNGDGGSAAAGSGGDGGGDGGDEGGCSCRAAGSSRGGTHPLLFLVAGIGLALSRRRRCSLTLGWLAAMSAACGTTRDEDVTNTVAHAFTETESGNNFQPSAADPLKAVDDIEGSITGTIFGDWYLSAARTGDRLFAVVDTQGSTVMDPTLRIFADTDTTAVIEQDDDDGPGLSPVVAGVVVPALNADGMYLFVGNTSGTVDYRLVSYIVDPASAQTEVESNDTLPTANVIDSPMVSATIGATDDDFFSFMGTSGDEVVIIVDDDPNGDGNAPTGVRLLDAVGAELAVGDNGLADDGNATPRHVLTSTGIHYAHIANASFAVSSGEYDLVVLVNGRPPAPLPTSAEAEPNFTYPQADGLKGHHPLQGDLSAIDTQDTYRMLGNPGDLAFVYVDTQHATGTTDARLVVSSSVGTPIESDEGDGPGGGAVVAGAVGTSTVTHLEVSSPTTAAIGDYHVFAALVSPSDKGLEPSSSSAASTMTPSLRRTLVAAPSCAPTPSRVTWTTSSSTRRGRQHRGRGGRGSRQPLGADDGPEHRAARRHRRNPRHWRQRRLGGRRRQRCRPIQASADGVYHVRVANDGGTAVVSGEYELVVFVTRGPVSCGDGDLDGTEICDDGNAVDGDGCSSTCVPDTGAGGMGGAGGGDGGSSAGGGGPGGSTADGGASAGGGDGTGGTSERCWRRARRG